MELDVHASERDLVTVVGHLLLAFAAAVAFGVVAGLLIGDPLASQATMLGHLASQQLLVLGGLTVVWVSQAPFGWRAVLGRTPSPTAWLAAALLGAIGYIVLYTPLVALWAEATGTTEPRWYATALALDGPGRVLAVFGAAALVPAVCEELFFRGYVLSRLEASGPWVAVAIQAIAFAAYHMDLYGLPVYLMSGLVLGLVRVTSGALWPCVVLHATNNAVGIVDYHRGETLSATLGAGSVAIGAGLVALAVALVWRRRAAVRPRRTRTER